MRASRFPVWSTLVASLLVMVGVGESQTRVEVGLDPQRQRAYAKVEAETATIIRRADKAHPAFDADDIKGPSLHYEVFGPDVPTPRTMPAGASGGKALFNTGTGEQTQAESQRNDVFLASEQPPLGTIAEYRLRFRHVGVYELFLRLAYWSELSGKVIEYWAAPSNASGVGAIHVKDFDKGRPLNSSWWRRHNNTAWNLRDDAWTVVDFGPVLEVRAEDLEEKGYVDVVWQMSASHPGLIIDSLVIYQGYFIDPNLSKYEQAAAFAALPLSVVADK